MLFGVLILTFLPVFSFLGQYIYCKNNNLLPQFRANSVVYWGDFVFIPLNFIAYRYITSTPILYVFVFLMFSFTFNVVAHWYWGMLNKEKLTNFHKKYLTYHMYFANSSKLNFAGYIHFIFSTIQTTVLFMLLFYPVINFVVYTLVFYYSVILFYFGVKMYGKIYTWNTVLFLIINIVLLTKVFIFS